MTVDPQRVVQLFVDGPMDRRVGSGYLVRSGLVLTAAHVFSAGGSCRVVIGIPPAEVSELTIGCGAAFCDLAADVAVLPVDEAFGVLPQAPLARLSARPGRVEVKALGFPRWKRRPNGASGSFRESLMAAGTVDPLSNRRGGTLEFQVDVAAGPDPDPDHDPWEGMSGAAVWSRGRIIGVVAEHYPSEGVSILSCRPLSTVHDDSVRARLKLPDPPRLLPDVAAVDPHDELLELHRLECLARCPRDAGGQVILQGREAELARLVAFCRGSDRRLWIHGPPWAGKTALVASFAIAPPEGVIAIAFFVSERTPADRFLDATLRRLGALLRRSVDGVSTIDEKQAKLELLLQDIAVAEPGFVLIVDGLDEDPRPPGMPPIAQFLPRSLPDGAKLIVTSRPAGSGLVHDHPLATAGTRMQLTASAAASDLARFAQAELDTLLREPSPEISDLLSLLAATDGFSVRELAELGSPPQPPGRVRLQLDARVGRILTPIEGDDGRRYTFAHAELRTAARAFFGPGLLDSCAQRIDGWVDSYRQRGWPTDTPAFCFRPYFEFLRRRQDDRVRAIATDPRRRTRLLARTGSHAAAAAEAIAALRATAAVTVPDIAGATHLAITGFVLRDHLSDAVRPEMASFLVRAGRAQDAIETVRTALSSEFQQRDAIAQLAAALYATDLDQDAEQLLRSVPQHDAEQVAVQTASLLAAVRPDLALRLIGGAARSDDQKLLTGLALDDRFVDAAVALAGHNGQTRLAIARVLARRRPEDALGLCDGVTSFSQWSAGDVYIRDRSHARVETARLVACDDVALSVLRSELDGPDQGAALVATALRIARTDPASARAFVDAHAKPWSATYAIGLVAVAAADRQITVPAPKFWNSSDLDVLARFGMDLASANDAYRQLLRSFIYAPLMWSARVERPEDAVAAVATELLITGELRDEDLAALAARLDTAKVDRGEIYANAARRMAGLDTERASALARTGLLSTGDLRDVVSVVAPRDLPAAFEILDAVERQHSATRFVLLGAIGEVIDPDDMDAVGALLSRLPQPADSANVGALLADCAIRLAGLLSPDDPRAEDLVAQYAAEAPPHARDQYIADRAVRLAAQDGRAAVALVYQLDADNRWTAAEAANEAASTIAPFLDPIDAMTLLKHCADMRISRTLLVETLAALAILDPWSALVKCMEKSMVPEDIARVLDSYYRLGDDREVASMTLRSFAEDAFWNLDDGMELAVTWAIDHVTDKATPDPEHRPGGPLAELRDAISGCNYDEIAELASTTAVSVRIDDLLAMAAAESPDHAADLIVEAAGSGSTSGAQDRGNSTRYRLTRLVEIVARDYPDVAASAIDQINWHNLFDSAKAEVIRGEALAHTVTHLAARDWYAAYALANTIIDRYALRDALAEIAARIPGAWASEDRVRALRDVLDLAAERLDGASGYESFLRRLLPTLRRRDTLDRAMQVTLLSDTARWYTDSGRGQLGETIALSGGRMDSATEAVEGLLAARKDLSGS